MPYDSAIDPASQLDSAQKSPILAIIRRRVWIFIPCVLVATAVAFALSTREEKKYSATAGLLFQVSQFTQQLFGFSASAGVVDPTTVQATNIELVSQPIIAKDVAAVLGHGISATRIASEIKVSPAGAGEIVNVTATDHSPSVATQFANTYAQQFVVYAEQSGRAQVEQAITQLSSQIRALKASTNTANLSALQNRLGQLEALASLQTGNVQLSEPALKPTVPSSPRIARETALGVMMGVLIGIIAMLAAERLDATVRGAEEVERLFALPILGMIPSSRVFARSALPLPAPATPEAEAFRLLRTQLRYYNVNRSLKSLLVTSSTPGDGKSVIAWNLACAAASVSPDSSVLLVDADLRRPRIAQIADVTPTPGLAEVLIEDSPPSLAIQSRHLAAGDATTVTIDVLPAGGRAPNPSELLDSQRFRALLANLHARYDLVIIDAPPIALIADAIPIVNQVSGVLVVARLRHTRREAIGRLRDQLTRMGAPCLGVVVNDCAPGKGYGRYYQYADGRTDVRGAPVTQPSEV